MALCAVMHKFYLSLRLPTQRGVIGQEVCTKCQQLHEYWYAIEFTAGHNII